LRLPVNVSVDSCAWRRHLAANRHRPGDAGSEAVHGLWDSQPADHGRAGQHAGAASRGEGAFAG
jgi:hypothetical protein